MGLLENDSEVRRFEVLTKEELKVAAERSNAPNIELISTENKKWDGDQRILKKLAIILSSFAHFKST